MNTPHFDSQRMIKRSRACAVLVLLSLIGLLYVSRPARADVAPPDFPPGSNPEPGSEVTQVRMVSETVVLEVVPNPSGSGVGNCYNREADPKTRLARAHVTANFLMRNLGSTAEQMTARFPLSFWNDQTNGYGSYPEISEVQVEVNGQPVATTNTSVRDSITPWANFDVTFPPNQDVPITVSYIADGACADVFIAFGYVLSTGAGWKDTIGQADIIVRLPYDASVMNIAPFTGFSKTSPGAQLNGREIRWHFENLEPAEKTNLEISLIWPGLWQEVLRKQQAVQQQATDGEAWGQLGKAYKELLYYHHDMRSDEGGQELYRRSVEAYAKAVMLLPNDGLWHAGFADLLINHYYYSYPDQGAAEMQRGLNELNRSLVLAPNNEKAREVIGWLEAVFTNEVRRGPDGYYFLTPTPPPTGAATLDPTPTAPATTQSTVEALPPTPPPRATTAVVVSVSTEAPAVTPTKAAATAAATTAATTAPTSAPKSAPPCGAAVALPLMMVGVVWRRGRRLEK